jgi:Ca2+-transporting ATPase
LLGDPTETALTAYAKKIGIDVIKLQKSLPRIDEIPFDSIRKMMTTIHKEKGKKEIAYTK